MKSDERTGERNKKMEGENTGCGQETEKMVREALFSMQDTGYKTFHEKLIPTVEPDRIIGVRTPELRKYARKFAKTPEAEEYLHILPHYYYEENNLHAFVIETIKDYEKAMEETERFLPYVDNWATCDSFSPKIFKRYPEKVYEKAKRMIASGQTYTIRYGVGLLMTNFLDEEFRPEMPQLVADIVSEEYYVNMMCAWYMATALAKQEESILPYLTENRLPAWVHNKTIQKAVESRRISPEMKKYLRTLRRK